ncbi:type II toxin-antitoxin system death-on-curing family toxin [Gracilibacillus sp. S3-1-1]|uniref:Type II toxin-antitoxin system death-on-curing family toxin n=1 Tax=Gracilibacillus pellucidus TaxID=3095368 RepID=A0ACC6M8H4_9BACI|nr:type II toxin-antitoxin system death-on-curing family toxin [Gracilibacillus sp. S3-1-1]MDX8047269.1 type II toxin-antitoxin system death-on-curing family toxin [Gracilibacillus sp. S3-1-1]
MSEILYLEGFASKQYFCDGNKRTAAVSCLVFLNMNGYDLMFDDSELELYHVTMQVADDEIPIEDRWNINQVSKWLECNCIKTG